ncbi:MAG: hypothetical protein C6P37_16425 [Caldibacillus debilis]|uniref:Uncharacterized protein n=1 Tax=Caldibacillus debilis TaxID=301148 RepID=A0A3E0JV52_9BACI|nr:MAG: hypothetical protein C6P37_16425 [Caldibacillus debilis]
MPAETDGKRRVIQRGGEYPSAGMNGAETGFCMRIKENQAVKRQRFHFFVLRPGRSGRVGARPSTSRKRSAAYSGKVFEKRPGRAWRGSRTAPTGRTLSLSIIKREKDPHK